MDYMNDNQIFLIALYALFLVFSLSISVVLNSIFLKFAQTLGIRNQNDVVKRWSTASKPSLGGITFFIVFLMSLIFVRFFYITDWFSNLRLFGLFFALIIAFLLGLFDDAYDTRPLIKFLVQLLCGVILVASGNYIQITNSLYLNYALTIFWVVAMMNSINMLDNMDAITTILAIVIVVLVLLFFVVSGQQNHSNFLVFTCMLGAFIGFLIFNWHPSKMFMGDTGTQFLGLFLASIGISYFWNGQDAFGQSDSLKQFTQVVLVFALPIIDTSTVFIKRIAKGSSPFVGGKDHTTHHLSYIGFSDRQVALIFAALAIVFAALAFSLYYIKNFSIYNAFVYFGAFTLIFIVLFAIAQKPPKVEK